MRGGTNKSIKRIALLLDLVITISSIIIVIILIIILGVAFLLLFPNYNLFLSFTHIFVFLSIFSLIICIICIFVNIIINRFHQLRRDQNGSSLIM